MTTTELKSAIRDKLPSFAKKNCLISKRAFEQCTSESVALFKSKLFKGKSILVLGAGLGVDDWAFSTSFETVTSIEPDIELNSISKFNFNKLTTNNIKRIASTAEAFLDQLNARFDAIYLDPDRRQDDKRQILLKDHQPNCIELMDQLLKHSDTIIIKASPLYDYEVAFKELSNVKSLYAISRNGEMKELLIVCSVEPIVPKDCQIFSVDCKNSDYLIKEFNYTTETYNPSSTEGKYFYEAGASIVKLRKFLNYGQALGMASVDISVPYFCSDQLVPNFIGRTFEIQAKFDFSAKSCQKYLKALAIDKINLKVRGLKYSTEALKASMKLKDGGDDYLFVLPHNGKTIGFHCRKIIGND